MMLFIKLKKRSEADKVDEKTKKDWSQDTAQHWLGRSGLEVALETLLYTITFTTAQNSHSLYTYSTSDGIVFLSIPFHSQKKMVS